MSSELASSIDSVIVVFWLPSTRLSSTPVTVTVCAALQVIGVNVSEATLTVASPVSALLTRITTFESGSASRTTVKVSVVPVSDTEVEPLDSTTLKPAASSSVVVALTV